jgi:hypothetical protein
MKILEAVYKSSDHYTIPDNRYGYGIPNFRVAYQLLKHDQNIALYGDQWLFATPDPFTNQIDLKFIARMDGPAKLELITDAGQVVAAQSFNAEKEEIYNYTFANLANQPAGFYTVKYSDSTITQSISLQKGKYFC